MSDPDRDASADRRDAPDNEFARAYSDGYAEGVRSALRELIANATRGHTVSELKYLAQSRLAQLAEEVERKRRGMLANPRTETWLRRPPTPLAPPRPWTGGDATIRVAPGRSYLVREPRPKKSLEIVAAAASRFAAVLWITATPGALPGVPSEKVGRLAVSAGTDGPSIESLGGEVRRRLQELPSTLVYLDGIEAIVLASDAGTALRFVQWILEESPPESAAVVASVHPGTLEAKELGVLEHSFQVVL